MANEIEKVLAAATAPLSGTAREDRLLQTLDQAIVEALHNLSPVVAAGLASSSGGSGSAGGSALGGLLGPGLLLSPLISGVLKLFGGGASSEPSPLVKFALPPAVNVNAGVSTSVSGAFGVDSGQGGLPRPVAQSVAPQITVQVQAMDSQSFMDRSGDIARAVRQAMLESSVLNDVVREV